MSTLLHDMIAPRQVVLGCLRMDSFWEDIMVLLINPNPNRVPMLKSLFSKGNPSLIHLLVVLEINGTNQPFRSSKIYVIGKTLICCYNFMDSAKYSIYILSIAINLFAPDHQNLTVLKMLDCLFLLGTRSAYVAYNSWTY